MAKQSKCLMDTLRANCDATIHLRICFHSFQALTDLDEHTHAEVNENCSTVFGMHIALN